MNFRPLLHKLAGKCGLEIHRRTLASSESLRLQRFLSSHNIDCVIDVGANIGQYAAAIREGGYSGHILSFEPLSYAHHRLTQTSQKDPNWQIAPRMALGAHDGETTINVSRNSFSSSILPILPSHLRSAPESEVIAQERVQLRRLDGLWGPLIPTNFSSYFLKLDTQGFELQVLDGAQGLLDRIRGLQLEVSLVPLYAGQCLFNATVERMMNLGYELYALFSGFVDPGSGRSLQMDAIFFRIDVPGAV